MKQTLHISAESIRMPYTFTRDDVSYYSMKERFESLTDNFQGMEDLIKDKETIEEAISQDESALEILKRQLTECTNHKILLEQYLAECNEDISTLCKRLPETPSLMIVKDYKMVKIGDRPPRFSRHILYRLFYFYYDNNGNIITSKIIRDNIPPSEIKAVVDEYIASDLVNQVEYFDSLRLEKKTCEKWIKKYISEGKIFVAR